MTAIIIASVAARRSSPAQVRAASRLRGSDGVLRPSKRLAMPSMPLCQPWRSTDLNSFGQATTPAFPSEVPTPGRWIRSGRKIRRGTRPRAYRLAAYPLKPHQVAATAPTP
jgi:hypothetical protein